MKQFENEINSMPLIFRQINYSNYNKIKWLNVDDRIKISKSVYSKVLNPIYFSLRKKTEQQIKEII